MTRRALAALVSAGMLFTSHAASAAPFFFSTGVPNGAMGMASRPGSAGGIETEAADDFITTSATSITSATFTGIVPLGALVQQVVVEVYRVFPKDSDTVRTPNVTTRVNSPSDNAFDSRDSSASGQLSFTTTDLGGFSVGNSVDTGINPAPSQRTGGEGPVSGEEITFDVNFLTPFMLPSDHYFFVPQVLLGDVNQHFLWASGQRPLLAPGETPFAPDLQAWIRNANLDPDWSRVGTDIVGGSPPPTFNGAFTLVGTTEAVSVPEPASWSLLVLALAAASLTLARRPAAGERRA